MRENVVDLLAWYVPPEAPPIPKNYLQCSICENTSNRSRVSISPSLPSSTAVPSVYAVIAGRSSPRCHQKRKNLAMQCPEENMTEILTRNMRYRTRIYFRNA
ncbi:hypothetical protein GQ600_7146 [Phytophthora cactorum]|nr:hypothetical protein GQ600_7146 [Phytophthora cactorum]